MRRGLSSGLFRGGGLAALNRWARGTLLEQQETLIMDVRWCASASARRRERNQLGVPRVSLLVMCMCMCVHVRVREYVSV